MVREPHLGWGFRESFLVEMVLTLTIEMCFKKVFQKGIKKKYRFDFVMLENVMNYCAYILKSRWH